MADIRLALAWLGKRNSKADRYGGGLPQMWKVDHSPAGGRSFGVVWALLSQSGAHTRKGRTALLRWPWLFTCGYHCMNSRDLVGQKPFLDLFLKLLAEASVSDEEMKVS